jgi:ABC-type transport system substrate-binding protein
MRNLLVPARLLNVRVWSSLLVLLLVLATAWLANARQDRKANQKPRPEEMEDDPKPKKDKGRSEDEDIGNTRTKVIRDPEDDVASPPPSKPGPVLASDLAAAARRAGHPVVKELYLSLAVPRDVITFHAANRAPERVHPLEAFLKKGLPSQIKATATDKEGQDKEVVLKVDAIKSILPYELVAAASVRDFLGQHLENLQLADPRQLSKYKQLQAAEQVLTVALNFNQSAMQRGVRRGDSWYKDVEVPLREQLLKVRLDQLQELSQERDWDTALTLARLLVDTYSLDKDQEQIADPVDKLLQRALKDPLASQTRMREIRQRLRTLLDQYPNSLALKPISDSMKQQAQDLFEMAKKARDAKDLARAEDLLQQAEETWPMLPQLRAERLRAVNDYPVLRVGVRELPKYMSPALACTDTERRAVELLFESLIKVSPDGRGVLHYEPGLAQGRPQVVPLGRQFQLPRNAFWSNDMPLTPADVSSTMRLLKKGLGTGRSAAWGALLEEVLVEGDPYRVLVPLRQGYLEPLSLMTFKILPQLGVLPPKVTPESEAFAVNPVSSGPFKFDRRDSEQGRPYIAFVANLNYASRPGKLGQPRIKEIRFFAIADPLADLQNNPLNLVLDLTADQAAKLRLQAPKGITVPPPGMNRRVYFLAVNHRVSLLKDNPDLRRALAHAINREKLLDDHFRGGLGRDVHKALNGPYPAQSWALNPALHNRENKTSLDPCDVELAGSLAKRVREKNTGRPLKLTLKYPRDDEAVQKSLAATVAVDGKEGLVEQVQKATGITLELQGCDPYDLRQQVEDSHNYELAYYYYDFPDHTYWLWPLLGPSGTNGENYLGYHNNHIDSLFQKAMARCDFTQVREFTRAIHTELLQSEMPVIPLWQLDSFMAIREGLKPVPFDPLLVFTDIEQWKLNGAASAP